MKRAGFTMIELIFVIVILGILAAVAIPKLAATRTDAEVSKLATSASTLVNELGTFYTAQGTFEGKTVKDVTNVAVKEGPDGSLEDGDTLTITDDGTANGAECLVVTIDNASDGTVSVTRGGGDTAICQGVQAATADLTDEDNGKVYNFGGSNVAY